ncbi:MAG: hypothetical protein QXG39_03760 [Candidatus Aenigmatarchaeota archaeon]
MKGIAQETIFLLVVITLIISASLVIFWKYIAWQKMQATSLACRKKYEAFCADLVRGKSVNWNDIPPKGCEELNIFQPTLEECKAIYPVS